MTFEATNYKYPTFGYFGYFGCFLAMYCWNTFWGAVLESSRSDLYFTMLYQNLLESFSCHLDMINYLIQNDYLHQLA